MTKFYPPKKGTNMFSLFMKKISGRLNYFLSIKHGHKFPFYYACEYPRSGGTWVAHMLSDYLQLSFPKNSIFPLGHSCIIHNHWKYNPKLVSPVYVVRDGRDVAVSTMFYALKNSKKSNYDLKYYKKKFPSLFQEAPNQKNARQLFRSFVTDWLKSSAGTRLSWAQHVRQWAFNENVIVAGYEDFHSDCFNTLKRVLLALGMKDIDDELLGFTVRKFSFEKQTGRKPGEIDTQNNKRKGIIGDWKNYFDAETAKIFNQHAGDVLLRLGYETDAEWYKSLKR